MAGQIAQFDCIVLGGGITGSVAAYELAARGLKVALVEKDRIGFEASSRNMGAFGALGKFAADLAARSTEGWRKYHNLLGEEIEFRMGGRLCVAESDAHIPKIEEMIAAMQAEGAEVEALDARGLKERFPMLSGSELCGLFAPADGTLNPAGTMNAFRRLLLETPNVTVMEGAIARAITLSGGRASGVETEDGRLSAPAVVVSSGIWSRRLLDPLGIHIPIQILTIIHAQTQPMPRLFDFLLRGPHYALRQFASGEVRISGGFMRMGPGHAVSPSDLRDLPIWLPRLRDNWRQLSLLVDMPLLSNELRYFFDHSTPPPKGYEAKVPLAWSMAKFKAAQKALPVLKDAVFKRVNGGLIDMTPDALPVLGPVRSHPGLYLATGFSGQGFGLGPVTGGLIAEAVATGRAPDILHTYRFERFAEGPLRAFPGVG